MTTKGTDVDALILRVIEGTDPEQGRSGFTNGAHKEKVLAYNRVRRTVDRVAPRTRLNDVQALLTLSTHLDASAGGKSFESVTTDDMMGWSDAIERAPFNLKPSTAGMYRLYVRRFFKWLSEPRRYMGGPRAQKAIPYPEAVAWLTPGVGRASKRRLTVDSLLSEADVKRMVSVCASPRDKALIMTLWDAGLRLQEAINLNVASFSPTREGGHLILAADGVEQKTGQRRIFVRDAVPFLVQHLNAHPLKGEPGAPLFFTRRAEDYVDVMRRAADEPDARDAERLRLTRSGLRGIVQRVAREAGLKKRVFPHLFRHSRATYWSARGVNTATLTNQFGWTATSKTPALYQHLSGDQVDDALLRAMGVKKLAEETTRAFEPRTCPFGHVNDASAVFCSNCAQPLDPAKRALHQGIVSADLLAAIQDPAVAAGIAEALAKKWDVANPLAERAPDAEA